MLIGNMYHEYFAKLIVEEVKKVLTKISEIEEQKLIRERREREELAEAKRNSLWGKTKELVKSVVPRGVLVFLVAMLVAPYLLCIIGIILYYSGSFDNHSKIEW